jgi:hypothetical protein
MGALKLSSPWAIYFRQVQAMFKEDPEVHVTINTQIPELKIFVDDVDKADAMGEVLPATKQFGSVTLKISIIPSNEAANTEIKKDQNVYSRLFARNPAWVTNTYSSRLNATFVIFKPVVVQYFNDDLADINGFCSTLYQNIAEAIFMPIAGTFFCTDTVTTLNSPLGEWP